MIKIAIVDDCEIQIGKVKSLLAECMTEEQYEVHEYVNAESFLTETESVRFDLVFLDIVLGQANGIDVGSVLSKKQPDVNIIFMSAHEEYFKDVYKVKHSYFLTKEFTSRISINVTSVRKDESKCLNISANACFCSSRQSSSFPS